MGFWIYSVDSCCTVGNAFVAADGEIYCSVGIVAAIGVYIAQDRNVEGCEVIRAWRKNENGGWRGEDGAGEPDLIAVVVPDAG